MDPTAHFFNQVLPQRAGLAPRGLAAALSIDLYRDDGGVDHWRVAFDAGTLRVSREEGLADCTVRASKEVFDRIAAGERNLAGASFRNEVQTEGDLMVWVALLKLLPGPPGARDPRDFFREWKAQRR